jgi:hypothetical protein
MYKLTCQHNLGSKTCLQNFNVFDEEIIYFCTNIYISHIFFLECSLNIEVFHTLPHVQTHMHLNTYQKLLVHLKITKMQSFITGGVENKYYLYDVLT